MSLRSLRAISGPLRVLAASRSAAARAAPRMSSALAPRVLMNAQPARAFSLTPYVRGSGETDVSLSGTLEAEIQYEKEAGFDTVPDFVKEFTKAGVWTIDDATGHDEVTLKRSFGNETVSIVFSIADIDTPQSEVEGEEAEEEANVSYPVRCSITISKPKNAPGALAIDTLAQEGAFVIENIAYYKDASLATDLTAEADWKRRGLYIGPQFDHLDVGVQEEFEKFLDERGVNSTVALFVPEYAAHKEQREYMKWLESVKSFIDA